MRLAEDLRERLFDREVTQAQIARALDRAPSRISELLRSLDTGRPMQDRLALLLDLADGLDADLRLVPRERSEAVERILSQTSTPERAPPSVFDDLFIDLSDGAAD